MKWLKQELGKMGNVIFTTLATTINLAHSKIFHLTANFYKRIQIFCILNFKYMSFNSYKLRTITFLHKYSKLKCGIFPSF